MPHKALTLLQKKNEEVVRLTKQVTSCSHPSELHSHGLTPQNEELEEKERYNAATINRLTDEVSSYTMDCTMLEGPFRVEDMLDYIRAIYRVSFNRHL